LRITIRQIRDVAAQESPGDRVPVFGAFDSSDPVAGNPCLSSQPLSWLLARPWSSWLLLSDTGVTASSENFPLNRQGGWTP